MSLPWPRWYQWQKAWAYRRLWLPELLIALAFAAAAIVLSEATWGDRAIIRHFYKPEAGHPWPWSQQPPWKWFNRYAGIGTGMMAIIALALIVRSYVNDHWRRHRVHLLYLLLVIALGPGVIVNATMKELWGRPRPRQVKEFGGWLPYRSITQPDKPGRGKSFPCGHCSASFALVALYFIGRRRHRALTLLALALALFLGGGMSAARVMSGAHFPSDALMAAVIVFLAAGFLYYAVLNIPAREDCGVFRAVCPGWPLLAGSASIVLLIALGGTLATPVHRTIWYDGKLTKTTATNLVLRLEIERADTHLRFGPYPDLAVRGFAEGFRGIGGSMKDMLIWSPDIESATQLTYRLWKRGFFSEFQTAVTAHVPVAGISALYLVARQSRLWLGEPPPPDLPIHIQMEDGQLELNEAWNALLDHITLSNTVIGPISATDTEDPCCP